VAQSFSRKVQSTRDEFLRQLPDAAGGFKPQVDNDNLLLSDGTKIVHINLTDLGIEEKGSLDLPMQRVDFSFENMSDDDIAAFMTHWDEHELRMGG
jgi:protein involved in polysaccharide export with SLBB domain